MNRLAVATGCCVGCCVLLVGCSAPSQPSPVDAIDGTTTATSTADKIVSSTAEGGQQPAGQVWAWGRGPLGDGSAFDTESSGPVLVPALSGVTAIAAGDKIALALKADGSLWAWGTNDVGELGGLLGTGSTADYLATPERVPGLSSVQAISVHGREILALQTDGSVFRWGQRYYPESAPAKVEGIPSIRSIASGDGTSIAVDDDGTAWIWGIPGHTLSTVPERIPGGTNAAVAGPGYLLKTDGSVWLWQDGQLESVPITPDTKQVADDAVRLTTSGLVLALPDPSDSNCLTGLTDVEQVAIGEQNSYALASNGSVLACGSGEDGGLGNGPSTDAVTPSAIVGLAHVVAIAAANEAAGFAIAIP